MDEVNGDEAKMRELLTLERQLRRLSPREPTFNRDHFFYCAGYAAAHSAAVSLRDCSGSFASVENAGLLARELFQDRDVADDVPGSHPSILWFAMFS